VVLGLEVVVVVEMFCPNGPLLMNLEVEFRHSIAQRNTKESKINIKSDAEFCFVWNKFMAKVKKVDKCDILVRKNAKKAITT